jgi:hypothetical protein
MVELSIFVLHVKDGEYLLQFDSVSRRRVYGHVLSIPSSISPSLCSYLLYGKNDSSVQDVIYLY